jgi:hypothetical protein
MWIIKNYETIHYIKENYGSDKNKSFLLDVQDLPELWATHEKIY